MDLIKYREDKDTLIEFLKQKLNLNIQDENEYIIAMYAFRYCEDKDVLLKILKQKPDLNIQDKNKNNIAMYAFKYCEDKDVLLELLKQKPDLNIQNKQGDTVAMIGLYNCINKKEVLMEILKQKPNLNIKNRYNNNSLITTFINCKYEDVLFEILKLKPDLNMEYGWNNTLIMYVITECKHKDVLIEILKHSDLNNKNMFGDTIAMIAFKNGKYIHNNVLLELIKLKPNLRIKNIKKKTALDYSFEYYVGNRNFDFDVFEKLYIETCKQDEKYKQLRNLDYLKIKRKYKVLPLVLFRHHKRYGNK
tara:strand:+ start:4421 stop:5335 length:915 start_codon:yes stop_codon:yes gene_type:complete